MNAFCLRLLTALSAALSFTGCSILPKHAADTKDHAFIKYWPPANGEKRLRLAVKDLIDMKGEVTSAGSQFLQNHAKPAEKDAACLKIARERPDVLIVGKTNLTEFAVGVSGVNMYFGTPHNPVSRTHHFIPGGSSSGSASAVANDLADVAFGTDTAGSIRVPSACCGIAGLKTTFGLIPLDGVYPIAPTYLDTVGPMAKDVSGLVKGMGLLVRGFEGQYAAASGKPAHSIRVGRLYLDGTDKKIDEAVDAALAKAGFQVINLGEELKKAWEQAQKDARTVAAANAWVYDQKFRGEAQVGARAKATVLVGAYEYRNNYRDALRRRLEWQGTLRGVFQRVDFIALPTLQGVPPSVPTLFGGTPAFEALVMGMQNTHAVNLAGNPALAQPVPLEGRSIPVASLELIGAPRSEAALLHAGRLVEGKP